MSTVTDMIAEDRRPAHCMDLMIASVESCVGAPEVGDCLMLISRNRRGASRFGQAVFLREEIDAGAVHGLSPVRRGGLARLLTQLAGRSQTSLRVAHGFWMSGIPARAEGAGDALLIAVDPAAAGDLQEAALDRGLTLSRVGEFRRGPVPIEERRGHSATDTVQAAFWARRRFWREPMLV